MKEILVDKTLIDNQCPINKDVWIYLDIDKKDVQMYTDGAEEEAKVKYNFIKMAKRYGIVKSDKEFWKKIKDVTIKAVKDSDKYVIKYEMEI